MLEWLESAPTPDTITAAEALDPRVGLRRAVPERGTTPALVPAEVIAALPRAVATIEHGLRREEWQAIARSRRMGQLDAVQLHQLLSVEGVDQRLTQMLGRTVELFEQFARDSDAAEAAPEAVDISEADLARQVVAQERQRLLGSLDDESAVTHGRF
ncbi:MAG: hypothetical protein QJR09_05900 [Micrococcus sp.]|nr:hypothetical protein [Micrococcus sp.]